MIRRLSTLACLALLPFLLAGCGEVQDAASDIAGDAASQAADAAAGGVKAQVCALVEDGLVSAQDAQVLSGLVSAADSAGVPADIITPLEEIAQAGDQVPADSAAALRDACEPAPSN